MPAPAHPCGGLPVTGISVSSWYCHHHQAWFAQSSRYHQTGEDTIQSGGGSAMQFGPFDNVDDVMAWLSEQVEELHLLGVCWDQSEQT